MPESKAKVSIAWTSKKGNPKGRDFKSVNKAVRFISKRTRNEKKIGIEGMQVVFQGIVVSGTEFFKRICPAGTPMKHIRKKYRTAYARLAQIVYPAEPAIQE